LTLTYELDLDTLNMYLHTKNEVMGSWFLV